MRKSVLQDWVLDLPGLRHQGVLLGAVRGCDTIPKHGAAKTLSRYLRAAFLNAHCGDPRKAVSFIEVCPSEEHMLMTMSKFFDEYDNLPLHYVMHLTHAIQIVGYYHPTEKGPKVTGIPCMGNGEPNGHPREQLPGFLVEVWKKNGRPSYQDATNPYREVREEDSGGMWRLLYKKICKKLHVNPETKEQLEKRLLSDEETFKTQEDIIQ
jgi:hypothetical protein